PPCSRLFPYTTLFRSWDRQIALAPGRNRLLAGQLLDGTAQRVGVVVHEAHGTDLPCGDCNPAGRARGAATIRPRAEVAQLVEHTDRKSTRLNSSHVKI